jgi:hypothetical protein
MRARGTVSLMENRARAMISERLGRFVRWFFTASPTAIEPPKPRRRANASGRRHECPRDE